MDGIRLEVNWLRWARTEASKIVTWSALPRSDHPTAAIPVADRLARTIGSIPPGQAGTSERVAWVTGFGLGRLRPPQHVAEGRLSERLAQHPVGPEDVHDPTWVVHFLP